MSLVRNAVWIIERNLDAPLSLGDLAQVCGVSPFHLAHAFARTTGQPAIGYIRARRLSRAARALADGAPDILSLALDAGYGSHEAFSRAFRAAFGATPEQVRAAATTEGLAMTERLTMPDPSAGALAGPTFVDAPAMRLVGLQRRQSAQGDPMAFAEHWRAFMTRYGEIAHVCEAPPVGVASGMGEDGTFDYLAAAEVTRDGDVPAGFVARTLAAQRYAVFAHRGHVSEIGRTHAAIWDEWLPAHPEVAPADAPLVERHCAAFDPRTGLGGVEIWVPIRA